MRPTHERARGRAGRRTRRTIIEAVRRAYVAGEEDVKVIAARYGTDINTIRYWRHKYGWPPRRPEVACVGAAGPFRWRCDCGRLNVAASAAKARRCACGQVPAWAA